MNNHQQRVPKTTSFYNSVMCVKWEKENG